MSLLARSMTCVGINPLIAPSYPSRKIAGHEVVDLPGGYFVMGSEHFSDVKPHWLYLPPYSIGVTPVTWSQYSEVMGDDVEESLVNYPATMLTRESALVYLSKKLITATTSLQ